MMQGLAQRYRNSSLLRKFIASVLFFLIIPLLVVAFFINSVVSVALNNRINDNALEVLKQTRSAVTSVVQGTRSLSLLVLGDEAIQQMILEYHSGSSKEFERQKIPINGLLQKATYEHPWIASIGLSDGENVILQAGQYPVKEPTTYHQRAAQMRGVPLWTTVHELKDALHPERHIKLISMIRSVNDLYRMQQIATLRLSIDEASFSGAYASAATVSGGQLYVVDSKGDIISSLDKSVLGTSVRQATWFAEVGNAPFGWSKISVGIPSTVFFYAVPDTEWRVIQIIPQALLNRQLFDLNLVIVVSMVICVVFGIVFSFLQTRTVLNPIKRMSFAMEKLKEGNFDVSLPIHNLDEIGRLSQDFVDMARRTKELLETVYLGKLREKEAALLSLESQINPHFLYNTLDSIRWMAVREGNFRISEQIEALSALFRHTLNQGMELTSLGAELDHLENYLMIQRNRFGDKISFEVKCDNGLRDVPTVKLVLQPLVENAIVHGLEPRTQSGSVLVSCERDQDVVLIVVRDDGCGADEQSIRPQIAQEGISHNVFALKNIHDRIQLRFGREFGLDFRSRKSQGTVVTVTLPYLSTTTTVES